MPRDPSRPPKPSHDSWDHDTWIHPLPVPEVTEGGESTWDAWHEAARELEAAFAPTQPSAPDELRAKRLPEAPPPPRGARSADDLMRIARRLNRVCPRPAKWTALYRLLEGDGYLDLQPPPVEGWIWGKLSHLQKRLRLREQLEWAERHGKVPVIAEFLESLSEGDWLHMGES